MKTDYKLLKDAMYAVSCDLTMLGCKGKELQTVLYIINNQTELDIIDISNLKKTIKIVRDYIDNLNSKLDEVTLMLNN